MSTKIIPKSIRGRLLLVGIFLTMAAMVVASLMIGQFLDRFVRRGLDERLDAQIALLMRSVQPDGAVDRQMLEEVGPFTQHRRGWGWRIDTPTGSYLSRDVVDLRQLHLDRQRNRRPPRALSTASRPHSGEADGFYVRMTERRTANGIVRVTAAAPKALFDRLRLMALVPVLATMGALSLILLAATLVQLHIGLRPLGRLRQSLADVRAGKAARITGSQPAELAPVVAELNGLLDENADALNRARSHVANLAHSLKTPLATLGLKLADSGRDPDGELGALVARIDGAIRHHLGRARAASPGAPGQLAVPLGDTVTALLDALAHIHAERHIQPDTDLPATLTINCDPQDLAEMLGNLLDNAWKWAKSRIRVTGHADGRWVCVHIDDDGPGLSDPAMAEALVPGRRLDERTDGHGFGLPIARELAELHGGTLSLGKSALGGLRATLQLPR